MAEKNSLYVGELRYRFLMYFIIFSLFHYKIDLPLLDFFSLNIFFQEERFLFPIYPLLALCAAVTVDHFQVCNCFRLSALTYIIAVAIKLFI